VAVSFADASRAARDLGWRAGRTMEAMCRDAWRWQQWRAAHAAEI
jgi:UDP-glucose 4-epimerase